METAWIVLGAAVLILVANCIWKWWKSCPSIDDFDPPPPPPPQFKGAGHNGAGHKGHILPYARLGDTLDDLGSRRGHDFTYKGKV